ncbi:MAG: Dolichyl-phosphate-mannose-protein mannosyltransferase [Pseudomonadota bacterium]
MKAAAAFRWPPEQLARAAGLLGWLGLGIWALWAGLLHVPGPHDNDWPLLMWLVKRASWSDLSPLAIGHYGWLHQLLAWWLQPLFGSTLAAAKVLSTLGLLVCVGSLYQMTRRAHGQVPALMVATLFALSPSALLTGQSEFADAPAFACFLAGLCLWWHSDERWGLAAGVCLGVAGLLRLHFVAFSLLSSALAAVLGLLLPSPGRSRGSHLRHGAWLVCGAVLGNLPGFVLNYSQHGRIGSAVADTFAGQVLYGVDELDFLGSYAAHPFAQILKDEPWRIVQLMRTRLLDYPELWGGSVLAVGVALWKWRSWPAEVTRHVLLMGGLAFAYFLLFVTLAWWLSPRLLFSLAAFNAWLGVVVVTALCWEGFRRGPALCGLLFAGALAYQWPSSVREVRARWGLSRTWWDVSTELVGQLRALGMKDPREAFVFDWNRFLVDDPELQPFYNFGFWNLLLPEFRAERPPPTPYLNRLPQLGQFLAEQGVRFLVLPQDSRDLQRFPALRRLVAGEAHLPGYRREATLAWDVLFVRDQAPAP